MNNDSSFFNVESLKNNLNKKGNFSIFLRLLCEKEENGGHQLFIYSKGTQHYIADNNVLIFLPSKEKLLKKIEDYISKNKYNKKRILLCEILLPLGSFEEYVS